ncbi:possible membrane protein (plasmid) [Rhodococcus jostii RHA1]|uniref:Probable membrane transporter protein n=1 Tax=Rhodococcus jostii (strain RHA1) TaxID=101510 RepID=Q0RXP4_RHOJR|nr:sulfite exporter TauE/SafE family protein [Rhodococcus jostii]ABG99942.1 possible membrane protein [Rhodococcus jostii RHA1]
MLISAIVLGICIGISLGALGGGGSILTVPALVYVLSQPLQIAVTESLVIVGITSIVAAISHARAGRVKWRAGISLGAVGGVAAWAGTALGRLADPNVALGAFAILLSAVSISLVWRTRPSKLARKRTRNPAVGVANRLPALAVVPASTPAETTATQLEASPGPRTERYLTAGKVLTAGIAIGVLTGFFGVGGGFVIVPVLVIALGYPMPIAVGTSLLVITLNSAVALAARSSHDALDWSVVLPVTASAIVGALVGKWLALRTSEKTLTRAFAVLLVAVSVYVGLRSSGLLPG